MTSHLDAYTRQRLKEIRIGAVIVAGFFVLRWLGWLDGGCA
jgi:hypothetical protein